MDDRKLAHLVNDLTAIATIFVTHQSLRERISRLVVPEIETLRQRVKELEANERAYEQIIGPKSYQEVADELATLKQGQRLPCPNGECQDKTQCWEPCGELGHSEEHCKVYQQGQGDPFGYANSRHLEMLADQHYPATVYAQKNAMFNVPVYTSAPTIPAGWYPLSEPPEKTGRYVVAHRGGCAGDAYYTAKEGDTHYPIGWSQMPAFQPSHWCKPPDKFCKDLLSAAPKLGEST